MKKAMISLLCVISLLTSLAFMFYEQAENNEYLNNIEMSDEAIHFYVRDTKVTTKNELEKFSELSKSYQATFIRTDRLGKDNKDIVYKSGIFSKDFFKKLEIPLRKGEKPNSPKKFLATWETGKKDQSGLIRNLSSDYYLTFDSLKTFYQKNESSVMGNYTLIVSAENREKVLDQLSLFFGISKDVLLKPIQGSGVSKGPIELLFILSVIILAVFCLMNVFYPVSRLKEIGVMKILGLKNFTIFKQLNQRIILVPLIFYFFTAVIQKFLLKGSDLPYFLKLSVVQFFIFAFCLLFSSFMLIFIKKIHIAHLLKNYFNLRLSLYFSYVLKLFVFVGLIFAIPMMTKEIGQLIQEVRIKHVYESEQKLLTLTGWEYADNGFQESMNGKDSLAPKIVHMYKELERTAHCQYIHTDRVTPSKRIYEYTGNLAKTKFFPKDHYDLMMVNKNYLEGLKFELPISLSEAFSGDQLTFFAPKKMKSQKKKVEFLIRTEVAEMLRDYTANLDNIPAKLIWYEENDQKIFSENLKMLDRDNGFVQNPIICCLNDSFIKKDCNFIKSSAQNNPLRILDTKKNRQAIQKAIINNQLERNKIKFGSVYFAGFLPELQIQQLGVTIYVCILILAILVSVLASYYIILIILTSKKKQMLVSRILGHSLFDRYRNEMYYFCLIYCFGLAEILILDRQVISIISYLVLVGIDAVIIYLMVIKREKTVLSLALKGEE